MVQWNVTPVATQPGDTEQTRAMSFHVGDRLRDGAARQASESMPSGRNVYERVRRHSPTRDEPLHQLNTSRATTSTKRPLQKVSSVGHPTTETWLRCSNLLSGGNHSSTHWSLAWSLDEATEVGLCFAPSSCFQRWRGSRQLSMVSCQP
jgi:hypothetical protein